MTFTPREYVDMALALGSDIDLGNASQSELDALAARFLATALVDSPSFELTYSDGSREVI